jgi:Asp-tRNA(Asn)/Glu-tRNA(Gln) amidotransferase C subunit
MTDSRSSDQSREEPEEELADQSERILDAVEELRALETAKRQEQISTPPFHRLAEDETAKSREIFAIAREEQSTGERTPRMPRSIDDIADEQETERAEGGAAG